MNSELRNKKFGFKRFINSFKNSWDGLKYAYMHEQSMFIHFLATLFTIILGFVFKVNVYEWIIMISLLSLVAIIELLNSSIEAVCDAVTLEYNPLIKISKDTASAAAFLASIISALVILIIFVPKFLHLIGV